MSQWAVKDSRSKSKIRLLFVNIVYLKYISVRFVAPQVTSSGSVYRIGLLVER